MKLTTPMPEKYPYKWDKDSIANKVNQLIDAVTELRGVVGGKSTYKDGYEQGKFDAEMNGANLQFEEVTKTPSLKETLLGEIAKLKIQPKEIIGVMGLYPADKVHNQALSDVETIINKLMP
jgi:hypothetical protein